MESSPSPFSNRGSALSISSGEMSSRLSELTMSSFSSRSRSAAMVQPSAVVRLQVRHQFACGARPGISRKTQKLFRVDLIRYFNPEARLRVWNLIVWLAFDQSDGFAGNRYRLQIYPGHGGDMC